MTDLSYSQKMELADILSHSETADRRFFAGEYGYKKLEIDFLSRHQRRPNNWSPTEQIFKDVTQQYPDYPLNELAKILEKIGRNDVKQEIEKFIRNGSQPTNQAEDREAENDTIENEDDEVIQNPIQEEREEIGENNSFLS